MFNLTFWAIFHTIILVSKEEIMAKKRVRYYDSETCDMVDYGIKKKPLPEDFEYKSNSHIYQSVAFTFYHVIAKPVATLIMKIKYGARIKNKKVLRPYKHQGVFFYGNHTSGVIDAFQPNRLRKQKNYIVVSTDATSIFGLQNIVLMLGGMPVATSYNLQKKFITAVSEHIAAGKSITIFPEATIWPYYTSVRPFSSAAFTYPVQLNCPSFTLTTTFQKRWYRRKPKVTTYVDGPFFPDNTLPPKEAKQKLRDTIYNTLKMRTEQYSTYAYYDYQQRLPKSDQPTSDDKENN